MLSNLFPQFFGGSQDGKSALSTGGNAGHLNGADRERIANASQLSDTPTRESLMRLAEGTGALEAQTVLLKQESEQKIRRMEAANVNLETRVKHAEQAIEQEKKAQKIIAKHGKNILDYQIESEVIHRNLDGYQSAMQTAESKIYL